MPYEKVEAAELEPTGRGYAEGAGRGVASLQRRRRGRVRLEPADFT